MKKLSDLVAEALTEVEEQFPWDLSEYLEQGKELLLLDIREPAEYAAMHIAGSINVPRGILESSCEFGFDDTIPELAMARDKEIAVICRSGNRSALAALTMKWMGYQNAWSLKTGLRGWNDAEQPMVDQEGNAVDIDDADEFLSTKLRPDQIAPTD